tara:strand:- start:3835 stop:4236 length:402 start_codon:yes stop_codon:yes gene_type:complete
VTGTIIKFPNPEEIIQRSKLKEQESYDTSINSICDSVIDFLNAWVEQIQPEVYESLISENPQESLEESQSISWFYAKMHTSQAFISVCAEMIAQRDSEIQNPDSPVRSIKFGNFDSFIELFQHCYKEERSNLD